MKVKNVEKLAANLHYKTEHVIHIGNLKQGLTHGFVFLNKVHRMIKFNQIAWLKLYIDMNIDLKKKARNDFENDVFKFLNNAIFIKTMENVRKHRDIKLVSTERRRNFLVLEPNHHITTF